MAKPPEKPGQSTIEAALTARDAALLRRIAMQRKGLTDDQRRALLLIPDMFDHAAKRAADHA